MKLWRERKRQKTERVRRCFWFFGLDYSRYKIGSYPEKIPRNYGNVQCHFFECGGFFCVCEQRAHACVCWAQKICFRISSTCGSLCIMKVWKYCDNSNFSLPFFLRRCCYCRRIKFLLSAFFNHHKTNPIIFEANVYRC